MYQELDPWQPKSDGMKWSSEYHVENKWPEWDFFCHFWRMLDFCVITTLPLSFLFFWRFLSYVLHLSQASEESNAQGILFYCLSPLQCQRVGGQSLGITFFSWRAIKLQEIYFSVVCECEWLDKIQNVLLIYSKNNLKRYMLVLYYFMLLLLKVGERIEEREEKKREEKVKGG